MNSAHYQAGDPNVDDPRKKEEGSLGARRCGSLGAWILARVSSGSWGPRDMVGHERCFGGAKLKDSFGTRAIRVRRKTGHGGFLGRHSTRKRIWIRCRGSGENWNQTHKNSLVGHGNLPLKTDSESLKSQGVRLLKDFRKIMDAGRALKTIHNLLKELLVGIPRLGLRSENVLRLLNRKSSKIRDQLHKVVLRKNRTGTQSQNALNIRFGVLTVLNSVEM